MDIHLEHCEVPLTARMVEAMQSLERSGAEIALIMEGARIVGVMTDGDIRRALLKGAQLETPLKDFVQRSFTSVGPGAGRAEVLDLMQARTLNQIPIVDRDGRLLGLHLLHQLVGRSPRPNWAVIMAGGQGTRLRPVTEHLPKPMVCVAGRPILERLVLHLVGHGIRRVFLAVNYLGHMVEKHFGDGQQFGCRIDYLREQEPLGTGGALSLLPENPGEALLVLNGDLVTQFDVGRLLDFHAQGDFVATLGISGYAHTVPFGCVETASNRITRFEEKPVMTRQVNAGIYVLNPALVARVPVGKAFPVTNLFEEALERGEALGAYQIEDDWIDVGQREQLQRARNGAS
jgi:dTDP-glucose pyrophosphorylase/predicted transcriptional regulator